MFFHCIPLINTVEDPAKPTTGICSLVFWFCG